MKVKKLNFPVYTDFNKLYAISEIQIHEGLSYTFINSNINSALAYFFANPSEFVCSLRYYPIDFSRWADVIPFENMKIGNNVAIKDSQNQDLSAHLLNNCYGYSSFYNALKVATINISRRFNNFLDYNPYTRIEIDLPFSSPVELNPVDVYGYTIEVYYIPDFNTGKATIYIQNDDRILYTGTATISVDIPLGNTNAVENLRNQVGNVIGIGTGITQALIGATTGNPFSLTSGVGMLSTGVMNSVNNNITHYTQKGVGNGVGNQFTSLKVSSVVKYPKVKTITQYNHLYGKPLMSYERLDQTHGYTEIEEIHLEYIDKALQTEIDEIRTLLKEGVILP